MRFHVFKEHRGTGVAELGLIGMGREKGEWGQTDSDRNGRK